VKKRREKVGIEGRGIRKSEERVEERESQEEKSTSQVRKTSG